MLLHPVQENGKKKRLILAQVKAGKLKPGDVRDFANVIRGTKGVVAGVFITLEKEHWTREMRTVAKQAGKFKRLQSATKYPRL